MWQLRQKTFNSGNMNTILTQFSHNMSTLRVSAGCRQGVGGCRHLALDKNDSKLSASECSNFKGKVRQFVEFVDTFDTLSTPCRHPCDTPPKALLINSTNAYRGYFTNVDTFPGFFYLQRSKKNNLLSKCRQFKSNYEKKKEK